MSAANHHNDDPVMKIYLREIGQIPRLEPEEEARLARRVRRGHAPSRQRMIQANLRLVVRIATGYANYGLPLLDLIAEGNIGLMKAVDRFDPQRGRFSTYAAWWIRQGICRALMDKSRTIRLTANMLERLRKMETRTRALAQQLQREPTNAELAASLGVAEARVIEWKATALKPVSLDAPTDEDSELDLADRLSDPERPMSYEELEAGEMRRHLQRSLQCLEPRARDILAFRYGLLDDEALTLEEIGARYSLTRERIRQIEKRALGKLRELMHEFHPSAAVKRSWSLSAFSCCAS